jgi:hypothetical protein
MAPAVVTTPKESTINDLEAHKVIWEEYEFENVCLHASKSRSTKKYRKVKERGSLEFYLPNLKAD